MKIWMTTDTHFEHFALCQFNGRPADFSQKILKGLKNLSYEDTLIHLGDICMGQDRVAHAKWILPIPCKTKILIRGNHDHQSDNWYLEHGWTVVCQEMMIVRMNKRVLLSHEPQIDNGHFDLNIHGHFHNSNYRLYDSENAAIITPKHHLLAVEFTNYQPVLLDSFLKKCLAV